MAYKIAVASSDGINVNVHFGAAESFLIYTVDDAGSFALSEKREVPEDVEEKKDGSIGNNAGCGCGDGCGPSNGGCGNGAGSAKVELVSDVRAVVEEKICFKVRKQLEKKAIANFDVDCTVQEALEKITKYFYSVDNHKSFSLKK